MGAVVKLRAEDLKVTPGSVAACEVVVRNDGSVVDQFSLDVVGDARAWARVEPDTLSLFPAAEGAARITFAPPRLASIPPGNVAFGLRARSREDPTGSAVEEGSIAVDTFYDTGAELIPRTSRGRTGANHELAIDNRGNAPINATVEGSDPDRLLAFDVRPSALGVGAGEAAFAKVRVKPAKRFWRGQPKTRSFRLAVADGIHEPMAIDGSILQEAMLPSWLGRALVALLVAAIALVALWFGVLQPQINSAAKQALIDAGVVVASPTPSQHASSGGGGGATPTPASSGGGGGGNAITPPPSGTTPGPSGLPGHPVDGRLAVDGTSPSTVTPKNTTLYITDLFFGNPNGHTGTLTLQRGTTVIASLRLENFRDFDEHFVTPIVVGNGQTLKLAVTCTDSSPCDPWLYFTGFTDP